MKELVLKILKARASSRFQAQLLLKQNRLSLQTLFQMIRFLNKPKTKPYLDMNILLEDLIISEIPKSDPSKYGRKRPLYNFKNSSKVIRILEMDLHN